MKTATIKLDGNLHKLENETVYVWTYTGMPDNYHTMSEDEYFKAQMHAYEWRKTPCSVGAEGVLVEYENVSSNALRSGKNNSSFTLRFDCVENGVPGNSNRNICRFHGWRGTTNDNSITAHGVRRITKIRELKNGNISVTVGNDLNPTAA